MKIIYESVVNEATFSPCPGGPFIVEIYMDWSKGKLRALSDDGVHGRHNVAFPNKYRNHDGDLFRVSAMSWNGTNYKVSEKDNIVSYGNKNSQPVGNSSAQSQPTQSQPAQPAQEEPKRSAGFVKKSR